MESVDIIGLPSHRDIGRVSHEIARTATRDDDSPIRLAFVFSHTLNDAVGTDERSVAEEGGHRFVESIMASFQWSIDVTSISQDRNAKTITVEGKVYLGHAIYLDIRVEATLEEGTGQATNLVLDKRCTQ